MWRSLTLTVKHMSTYCKCASILRPKKQIKSSNGVKPKMVFVYLSKLKNLYHCINLRRHFRTKNPIMSFVFCFLREICEVINVFSLFMAEWLLIRCRLIAACMPSTKLLLTAFWVDFIGRQAYNAVQYIDACYTDTVYWAHSGDPSLHIYAGKTLYLQSINSDKHLPQSPLGLYMQVNFF